MERLWTMISYGAPFIAASLVALIGWLFVADKTVDVTFVLVIIFYSLPAYVFFIAPCYVLLKLAIRKLQLRAVAASLLALFLALMQTMLAGQFLRVELAGYLYLFIVFASAACVFIACKLCAKKSLKKLKTT